MNKKYELTNETRTLFDGMVVRRIRYADGRLGGWLQDYHNLSQDGRAAVFDEAVVFGNAKVSGNARICDKASVRGRARIYGDAVVCGDAAVCDDTWGSKKKKLKQKEV